MQPLTLDRSSLDAMHAHGRAAHPEECCGAIVERDGKDVVTRFTNIQNRLHEKDPVANPRDATTAYSPEPKELFAVLKSGDEPGSRLKVFYHSHAINGSYFSAEDVARAMFDGDPAYPDVTYVVVSDARERGEARAFRWNETSRAFVEVPIEVRDA
jgi:proteasome lid subunit RPN8/RPN11